MNAAPSIRDEESEQLNCNEEIYDNPCKMKCDFCLKEVTTFVNEEYNIYTWVVLIFVLTFYGILIGLPILVCTIPLCKNKNHTCPDCLNLLFTKRFSTVTTKGIFLEIKLDKCVIILRKTYIYAILIVFLLLGVGTNTYSYIYGVADDLSINTDIYDTQKINHEVDDLVKSQYGEAQTQFEWADLINDCGARVIVNNSARAQEIFDRKYRGKIVTWKAHFLGAVINQYSVLEFNLDHVITYYIRMLPSESMHGADIMISMNHEKFMQFKDVKLMKGEPIEFTAEIKELGNEWNPHHFHGISIKKIDEFIESEAKITLFKGITFDIKGKRNYKEGNLIDLLDKQSNLTLSNSPSTLSLDEPQSTDPPVDLNVSEDSINNPNN